MFRSNLAKPQLDLIVTKLTKYEFMRNPPPRRIAKCLHFLNTLALTNVFTPLSGEARAFRPTNHNNTDCVNTESTGRWSGIALWAATAAAAVHVELIFVCPLGEIFSWASNRPLTACAVYYAWMRFRGQVAIRFQAGTGAARTETVTRAFFFRRRQHVTHRT